MFGNSFSRTLSTRSSDSPYSISMSQEANEDSFVMLTTLLTSLLRMMMMLPLPSLILVVRMPMSITVPLRVPTAMMSPTRNSPSKMMNRPDKMSATSSFAPNEMAMDRMPADASSVVVSMPMTMRQ